MILVTGGAGYIGSQFVRHYTRCRPTEKVVVIDSLVEGHVEALEGLSNVHLEQMDIGDYEGVRNLLTKHSIDAVVHFAAFCYVGESQENPGKYYQNNVSGSINLFRAMEDCLVRKLVFSSSCATYGLPLSVPINEKHPQNPISIYGQTKLLVEKILSGFSDACDWSFTALRYFNAAGADRSGMIGESHDPETHIIPLALKVALGTKDVLQVYGEDYDTPDGTCVRDYIHVEDLAAAHLLALEKLSTQKGGQFLNLGTAYGASVKEIIDVCEQVSGRKINHVFAPRRSGDPPVLVADASKANAYLGWSPKHNLRSIIETAWAWQTQKRY
ncbi:MAG: UDP-glucose 4-epimerase GalE [Candidatus Melainabacteria bacterium]|nr:UDP-glucose 4-epimerase GalE [Candidatus Melainabacteria bacterium]